MPSPRITTDLDRWMVEACQKYDVDLQVFAALITSGMAWNERLIMLAASLLNDGLNARNQAYTGAIADYKAGPTAYANDQAAWFAALGQVAYPIMDQTPQGRGAKRLG